jgi:hypothetical protein
MALRFFILRVVTRPVLVPIAVGSFGLWYGGFDVAYVVSRKIATTLDPDLPVKTSQKNRIISSLAGVSIGALFGFANYSSSPFKNIEFPELQMKSIFRDLPKYIKSNVEVLKTLNINRCIFLFVSSGFISGFSKCIVETYLSHHV